MKFAGLKTSLLFLYGFSVGLVLFYIQFRRGIIEFIEKREQELRDKKRRAESCSSLDSLEPEQKSLTLERFFRHLRNNYGSLTHQTPCLEVKDVQDGAGGPKGAGEPDITSTGQTIRQYLGTEYGDPISFQYFESIQTLRSESTMEFGTEFVSCYPSVMEFPVFRNISSFSSVCNLQNQTKSVPIFSTAMDKKLKINKSERSRVPPAMDETDFKAFAKERLKMPSAVFVTPYPLHIMFRKLRRSAHHSSHTDFGFYHPLILPELKTTVDPRVSFYHIFQNSVSSEKYGPDLDLRCVHPNDYKLDSELSLQFRELLLKLIDEHVPSESWVGSYYCPSRTTQQVTRYLLDLPEYKLFILPLSYNANSHISHILSEYYKIVQKPF